MFDVVLGGIFIAVVYCTLNLSCENVKYIPTEEEQKFLLQNAYKKELKIMECTACKHLIPDKTKHCKMCNKCVTGFDHHCVWLNTCVGG